MFLISKPAAAAIRQFLDERADDRFSYSEVGATAGGPPAGYTIDHNRVLIGNGEAAFERAREAVCAWKMFNLSWVDLYEPDTPIELGRDVAILIRHFGFYSLNAARIVYVIDESGGVARFGFAYGTLTGHEEIGEERFSVELHRRTGEVWYDLYAFSRPGHFLARVGYPLSRFLQKGFAKGSLEAMKTSVADG